MKYVFGPLRSRRLGVSLGVGLIPAKTCNLDCIYCEARATTQPTNIRREFVPTGEVIRELDETLKHHPALDSITFSGAGEPTLHNGIGKIIDFLKSHYPQYRVTLLTNGLLLGECGLQKELEKIDLVIPSLDGSCQEEFDLINRPNPPVRFADAVAALENFTRQAKCPVYLEIFIVPGINDSDESIRRFAGIAEKIRPAKIQLNSLDRPGVDPTLRPAPEATLQRFYDALCAMTEVEIVRRF